ncbi:MAG: hypothetical protein Q4B42_00120 [Oscillospiraceae bacterium]|nr:hypothetical protein [Oscillospiraceae bacterium]
MKKAPTSALALFFSCLLFAGCSGTTENDVSAYVSPESFGGGELLPEAPPSAALPEREKLVLTLPVYKAEEQSEESLAFTENMRYAVDWPYFKGEEFSFLLPPGWNADNLELVINASGGLRQFMFYLRDSESGTSALILKIDCLHESESAADYGTALGTSYNGEYRYIRAAVAGDLPEAFAHSALYSTVYEELYSEDFTFQVNT